MRIASVIVAVLIAAAAHAGQTVAFVDVGMATDHIALVAHYVGGYDFAEHDDNPYDDAPNGSHGTHVAGILHAVTPQADIAMCRVFDDQGHGYYGYVRSALWWIAEHEHSFRYPITVVSLELGTPDWHSDQNPPWAMLEQEFAMLRARGMTIVCTAGDDYKKQPTVGVSYPGSSPQVICVMGSQVDAKGRLKLCAWSNRLDRAIAAPGNKIIAAIPDWYGNKDGVVNDVGSKSGTSMAAPYVAAAAVLIREQLEAKGLVANQESIYGRMVATSDVVLDGKTKYRVLNLARAVAP